MTRTLRGWLRYQWNALYTWLFLRMYPAHRHERDRMLKRIEDQDTAIEVLVRKLRQARDENVQLKAAPVEEMDLDSYPPITTGGRN